MVNDNSLQITIRNAFDRCTRLMHSKGKEYSPGEDRLHNFKEAGELQSISPEQALFGMLTKHLVSLADMCQGITAGGEPAGQEMWTEKLTDSTNYLFLLTALLKERYGWTGAEAQLVENVRAKDQGGDD